MSPKESIAYSLESINTNRTTAIDSFPRAIVVDSQHVIAITTDHLLTLTDKADAMEYWKEKSNLHLFLYNSSQEARAIKELELDAANRSIMLKDTRIQDLHLAYQNCTQINDNLSDVVQPMRDQNKRLKKENNVFKGFLIGGGVILVAAVGAAIGIGLAK